MRNRISWFSVHLIEIDVCKQQAEYEIFCRNCRANWILCVAMDANSDFAKNTEARLAEIHECRDETKCGGLSISLNSQSARMVLD